MVKVRRYALRWNQDTKLMRFATEIGWDDGTMVSRDGSKNW